MAEYSTIDRFGKLTDSLKHAVLSGKVSLYEAELLDGLPDDWNPVVSSEPPRHVPLLGLRESGYNTTKWEIVTVKYDPQYRPGQPWITITNDSITDSGASILAWQKFPEALK